MNVAQSGSEIIDTHPIGVGGPAAGSENTSTIAASTSADPPQNHGYPPCNCWHNPKDKCDGRAPIPLNLVLPPVRTELARAIRALNSIITLVEERVATGPEDTTRLPPPDILDAFSSQREVVVNCLETASIIITTTPGYVCEQDSMEHERCYSERYKELSDVEDIFTRSIKDAEPLLKARDELLIEERRQR
ncbi:hypothetical protein K466DRAFT_200069 [Polyporus arcularius HHB13444]|uniref:Uncharacterized protein n=1 Tax=Polyporus arcularius HHB13444 TaxID=1314778 RepID=A0A5C3P981_9APHY|nr:hypothetical protein K466DRAFT_200069 [Polyporus arcularius HHB13444]